MEIGTGWVPSIPLFFWLCGQKECYAFDIDRLLKPSLTMECIRQLNRFSTEEKYFHLNGNENKGLFEERKNILGRLIENRAKLSDILDVCRIHYLAPVAASGTNLSDSSIDLVFSNTVMEHLSVEQVPSLLKEIYRVLVPGGFMVHLIDTSDHFFHSDRPFSSINFLQFSEEQFGTFNSRFLFQNRIRASAWQQLFVEQGFDIIFWHNEIDEKAKKVLPKLPIDKAFVNFNSDELFTVSIPVVVRRT